MPRHRTTEDRLIAHLALLPYPLSVADLATALEVDRGWVMRVLGRLREDGKVVSAPGPRPGVETQGGRPAALFSLAGAKLAAPELIPLMRKLTPGTAVVTPSGREAVVRKTFADGYAKIRFLDGDRDETTIHVKLLRAFQAGRERPDPVRVPADA